MLGRKKVNKVDAGEENCLQWFLSHAVYDMFILLVILLNCVALCVEDPKVADDDQLEWLIALKWFFNVGISRPFSRFRPPVGMRILPLARVLRSDVLLDLLFDSIDTNSSSLSPSSPSSSFSSPFSTYSLFPLIVPIDCLCAGRWFDAFRFWAQFLLYR